MEIIPADIAQVQAGRNGRLIAIDDDVLNIAKDLKAIDPCLRLRFAEDGEYFVVYREEEGGDQYLVLTSQELNPQIVERIRQITHSSYDYAKEVAKADAEAEKASDHALAEATGEAHERLYHALRKDMGVQSKIIVPKGFER